MTPPNDAANGIGNVTGAAGGKKLPVAATFAGPVLVGALFVLLAAVTWRKWPDCFVDFGLQLYMPWRINEGAVLYRDLFYISGGPLSQYFNALLFKIFGVSFSTLIWANLLIAAALVAVIYRRFLAISDTLTATTICLGLVTAFIFAHYTTIGNYNYIAPYSHDAVHGVFLSILVVGLLSDWLRQPRLRLACLAGLGAGMVFLTKPDIFIALMTAVAATLGIHWTSRREPRFPVRSLAGFAAAFLLPLLFFFLLFLHAEDWHSSLRSVVFGWIPLLGTSVPHNPYYARFSGMDQPVEHLQEMAAHFLCASLLIGVYTILFRLLGHWTSLARQWRWLVWLVSVVPLLVWAWRFNWTSCGASLPLWCVTSIVCLIGCLRRKSFAPEFIFPLVWTVFALMMMAKMGLFCRVWQYGFVLAMPAFAAVVYFLIWLLPALLEKHCQAPAKYFRAVFLPVLLIGFTLLWRSSASLYSLMHQPVGSDGDQIVTYGPRVDLGDATKSAVDWMNQNMPANATLAVVPYGVTLNYLTRHVNPTPCMVWDPNVLAVCGQKVMTESLKDHPPDYVLLVGGSHGEWNIPYFGADPNDGAEVMDWIRKNYRQQLIIEHEPLRDDQFGLEFLKYTPSPASVNNAPGH